MKKIVVVSLAEQLETYKDIATSYGTAFELNDFYNPDILDSEERTQMLLEKYRTIKIPSDSTMHGAFFDVVIFSTDARIREIGELRMRQSMEIARKLGLKGVVFHTNCQPELTGKAYKDNVIVRSANFLKVLLEEYPEIEIYLENMFDDSPEILGEIAQRLSGYNNFGVCLDYAHIVVYSENIEEWVQCLAPFVKHVHISDNDLISDLHLGIGSGKIDWKEFAVYYKKYFKECSILVEVIDPEEQKKSLDFLSEIF